VIAAIENGRWGFVRAIAGLRFPRCDGKHHDGVAGNQSRRDAGKQGDGSRCASRRLDPGQGDDHARAKNYRTRSVRVGYRPEVIPDGTLDQAIDRWVTDLATRPQIRLVALKRVLNATYETPLSVGLQLQGQTFEKLRFNPESSTALTKKNPDFSAF
jgi:hypothetical protein